MKQWRRTLTLIHFFHQLFHLLLFFILNLLYFREFLHLPQLILLKAVFVIAKVHQLQLDALNNVVHLARANNPHLFSVGLEIFQYLRVGMHEV